MKKTGIIFLLVTTFYCNAHSPGPYRSTAAIAHGAGFYKAFDIKPGDAMWFDKKDRVKIW